MNYDIKEMSNKYSSYTSKSETAQQQLLKTTGSKVKRSSIEEALKGLSGLLKDKISDEQFQEMLKDAHL